MTKGRHVYPVLRQSANGRDCTLRIPGVCNGDPATTILAHVQSGGMGMKCEDTMAFFACAACHDLVDRRDSRWADHWPGVVEDILRAVAETQRIWLDEGLMTVKGGKR